jgi:glucose-6-phosphate isomerase
MLNHFDAPVAQREHTHQSRLALWRRYCEERCDVPSLGLSLDVSRIRFGSGFLAHMEPRLAAAFSAMADLEAGALSNRDENRMVGHYWLRAAQLAPTEQERKNIRAVQSDIQTFAQRVHCGDICGAGGRFEHLVHVGIGGSTLGPQFACDALRSTGDSIQVHFLDNADPDGVDMLVERLGGALGRTLVSVVSKSGWTPTPRRVQLALEGAYARQGLEFRRHAVATTMEGTELDQQAQQEQWLARFALWDWVGGRTSVTSAVGLLPLSLQGINVQQLLEGACEMDRATRVRDVRANPAALLAIAWYWEGQGRGDKAMVLLPYKDRLSLLTRYVRQLVMESLGKRYDRNEQDVRQGLTVYGHKGTTDQHAYVQQLRDGRDNCFITFVVVLRDRLSTTCAPERAVLGDHLFGGFEGTRDTLFDNGRDSLTIALPDLSARSLGALIALFERAVGLYAELINVNAYHQPGVNKNMAGGLIELQAAVLEQLEGNGAQTAEEIAEAIGRPERCESVFMLLEHLSHNARGVRMLSPNELPQRRRWQAGPVQANAS